MANDLTAFEGRPTPDPAPAVADTHNNSTTCAEADKVNRTPRVPGVDEPVHVAGIPALEPTPAPGDTDPRPATGKESSANAHDESHAPIVGWVDHQIPSIDGTLINVHTPGVVLLKKPDTPSSE